MTKPLASGRFAFEYRGVYTPTNADEQAGRIFAAHNPDYDWGLWGHNLRRVLSKDVADEVYALTDGKRNKAQFCFSSETLYRAIESYVIDQYGANGPQTRLTVMPNDNDLVCQCAACRKAGNTPTSATPAVSRLLHRLAHRFPDHLFFTASYGTTATPPTASLPKNVGVLVSAIALPLQGNVETTPAARRFVSLVQSWSKQAGRIYVWDYTRNYDNYLTPYPCLGALAARLKLFKRLGVKGVFYNGSTPSYAAFDEVQTAVLSALLIRPEANLEDLTARAFQRYYPVSAETLLPFYMRAEATAAERPLPFYGGIEEATTGLSVDDYRSLRDELARLLPETGEDEHARLSRLIAGLDFTVLELTRLQPPPYGEDVLSNLDGLKAALRYPDMAQYREARGRTVDYLAEWEESLKAFPRYSQLRGVPLTAYPCSEELAERLPALTDGVSGFASSYHEAWVITSEEAVDLTFPTGPNRNQPNRPLAPGDTLTISALYAPCLRTFPPAAVRLYQGDKLLLTFPVPEIAEDDRPFRKVVLSAPVPPFKSGLPLRLHLERPEGHRTAWAIDEIEWLPAIPQ